MISGINTQVKIRLICRNSQTTFESIISVVTFPTDYWIIEIQKVKIGSIAHRVSRKLLIECRAPNRKSSSSVKKRKRGENTDTSIRNDCTVTGRLTKPHFELCGEIGRLGHNTSLTWFTPPLAYEPASSPCRAYSKFNCANIYVQNTKKTHSQSVQFANVSYLILTPPVRITLFVSISLGIVARAQGASTQ